jgi:cytidylate kinase
MAIITISRAAFSGVEELAKLLATEMGYRICSREELLARAAEDFGALKSELESALIHRPGLLEGRGLKKLKIVNCARATMAAVVRDDDIVYHGEAGHLLLGPLPHHLRVRAVAPMDQRVTRAMPLCGLPRDKAEQYVRDLDEKRNHWVQWVHGVHMDDPRTYDLGVNLERIPLPSAVRLIADAARQDFQTTPESQEAMADFALACEVQARVGLSSNVAAERMEIAASGGVVTIRTTARYMADAEAVGDLARKIDGVTDVRSELQE